MPLTEGEYSQRVNRVMDYISAHLGDTLDLEILARIACFSPFHFHRVFKGFCGETVADFIRRKRMEMAGFTLVHGRVASLTRMAMDLGFGSLAAFSRAFKQHFGKSPARWMADGLEGYKTWAKTAEGTRPYAVALEERKINQTLSKKSKAAPSVEGDNINVLRRTTMLHPAIESQPETRYVYLRAVGPYGGAQIQEAWGRVYPWAQAHGLLGADFQMIGISLDDPHLTPSAQCRYDAGVVITNPVQAEEARTAGLSAGTLPAGKIAVFHYKAKVQDFGPFFDEIYREWLPTSGYLPAEGPCYERYTPKHRMDEPGIVECDICVPVVPA